MTVVVRRAGLTIAAGSAAFSLGVAALGAGAPLPVIVAATVVAGIAAGPGGVTRRTVVQVLVPPEQIGRVCGHVEVASSILTPIAYLAAGNAADSFGARPVIGACAIVMLVAALAPLLVPSYRNLRLPASDMVLEAVSP